MGNDFRLGLYRRIFNKNLKDAIERNGFTYVTLREKIIEQSKIRISVVEMSHIVNFKHNPSEERRIALALALEVAIDELFPEKYDELYDRISPSVREAELKVDFLRLNSPELLRLEAPETADLEALEKEKVEKIAEVMMVLPHREKKILQMRYGLGEYKFAHTLEEVAKQMGVTRERIRQMEAKALERLRTSPLKVFSPHNPNIE